MHKWSSLMCTAFLLMLCITGLPLIFHSEIDRALGYGVSASAPTQTPAPLADIERAGLAAKPGWVIQYFVWEPDKPGVVTLSMAPQGSTSVYDNENVLIDAVNAQPIAHAQDGGPMDFILTLHGQLFLGPLGPLILGAAAILFLIALISGVIIYAPFARKRAFAHVRLDRSRTTKWLDLHNVAGAVIAAWMLVVGATGLINTWGEYVIQIWQMTELSAFEAPSASATPHARTSELAAIVSAAEARVPDSKPYFVAYPGSLMAREGIFAVYMLGDTALTRFVFQPVLIDAASAQVIATPAPPWYVSTLALSQPLHFGDYGGLGLKIVWALLDLVAIFVLASGLLLTFRPRTERANPDLLAQGAPR